MKHTILKIACICCLTACAEMTAFAQKLPEIVPFGGISQDEHDKYHQDYPVSSTVAFANLSAQQRDTKIDEEWHKLWEGVLAYQVSQGLKASKKTKVYVHLHFAADGTLDYFGYHFPKETEYSKQFIANFRVYMQTHKFGFQPGVKFSQCGEIDILPAN